MFRSLYITKGEKITIRDNWIIVLAEGEEKKVPIEDIQIVVVDNPYALISTHTLEALANNGTCLVTCGRNHMPCCSLIPMNKHYHPFGVLKKQIALTTEFKNLVWREIVKSKIINQGRVMEFVGVGNERMFSLAEEVLPGDIGNREGIAAKLFFRAMYGYDFLRFEDDIVNKALDYGYSIIRSVVARSLCAYGYNCVLGIHHINESNAFNLADDFMEPLRPLVDLWVWKNKEELVDELSKNNKLGLVSVVNQTVVLDGKKMKVYNAVDRYVSSFTSCINESQVNKLLIPCIEIR